MFWPYNRTMAMGTRKMRERQEDLWYGGELPTAPGHPFYRRLNEVLDNAKFDPFCETSCASFYHDKLGRPSCLRVSISASRWSGSSKDWTASAASHGGSPIRSPCASSFRSDSMRRRRIT